MAKVSSGRDRIQEALDRAVASAGPAMRANFVADAWAMDATEFREFLKGRPVGAISTVSPKGRPHTAPLDLILDGDTLVLPTFANAVRLQDIRTNPHVSIVSWDGPYKAIIVYGEAAVKDGDQGEMVNVRVVPDRIYAIRPPAGHHAADDPAGTH